MSKSNTIFACQSCGYQSGKWIGRCPACEEWDSFVEEVAAKKSTNSRSRNLTKAEHKIEHLSKVSSEGSNKVKTKIDELDRALGGGIEPGSLILLGGDPGIGKSTLASQVAGADNQFGLTLYVSGEESSTQVKGRSERLKLNLDKILFTPETNVEIIAQEVIKLQPSLLIVDSIQTIFTEQLSSAPGSVGQIRESAAILLNVAKSMLIPVILIGHVTKEGAIAGPRVLEHMVDVVLYFEGEQGSPFRIVRSVKNRFGSSLELGLFEMKADGLISIENPSSMLLAERALNIPGSVVSATIAGFRPLLVEIQALVAPSFYPSPKRTGVGIDLNRLSIIIAIIEKRAGIHIGQEDIFVNAVGGVKVEEPAIDLAIAVAIVSGFRNIPIDNQTVVFGELGLGAEVRAAPRLDARLNEAKRLGFKRALVPKKFLDGKELSDSFKLEPIETLAQALEILF